MRGESGKGKRSEREWRLVSKTVTGSISSDIETTTMAAGNSKVSARHRPKRVRVARTMHPTSTKMSEKGSEEAEPCAFDTLRGIYSIISIVIALAALK